MFSPKILRNIKIRCPKPTRSLTTASAPIQNVEERKSTYMSPRILQKKPAREPFVKNLFLGEVDTTLLPYPEILENDELSELNNRLTPIANYFQTSDSKLTQSVWDDLKALGLTDDYKSETAKCKLQEVITDSSVTAILNSHQNLGFKALLLYGTEQQKAKYLNMPNIGFCLLEGVSGSMGLFNTAAVLDEDQIWNLNGEKRWVTNAANADIFVVFAQTEQLNYKNEPEPGITVFLVDPKMPGVTIKEASPIGVTEAGICSVAFDNVKLMSNNILGAEAAGIDVATSLLKLNRLSIGTESISILKKCSKQIIEETISMGQTDFKLTDMDWCKKLVAEMVVKLYAMESITYLTAGLVDTYENQDVDVESTIVKVFSSENCVSALESACKLLGPESYNQKHPINKALADARRNLQFDESNILLKHYIALVGLKHAGVSLGDIVRKNRNPLFNPSYILKKLWLDRQQAQDNPKLVLNLDYHYHPSLRMHVQMAEYCVHRLNFATEQLLSKFGPEVVFKHTELERLGNMAIDIYTMFAVLGRASRSYCIGLQNADAEVLIAATFCLDATQRVKKSATDIIVGPYENNDINHFSIGQKAFESKNYFVEHPIKRNF